ncbi:MAG: hypothetical protein QNJ35_17945 [Paracoccaceae bacterium]|nr:hypothetical protein [Paracoccaceae bacterium]
MIGEVPGRVSRARAALGRPGARRALKITGLTVLVAGAVWAVAALDLTWADLSLFHLALNVLLLTPAMLAVAAVAFRITARALGRKVSAGKALRTVAAANVAELLPLPGGAVVRGAALVEAGAGVGEATHIVLMTALLTLGMTVALSATALGLMADPVWHWLGLAALAGVAVILVFLSRRVGPGHLASMVAVRIMALALTVLRLGVAFATLGTVIGWREAALYAAAPTLGATVGIVPAGLGVNEAIAAALAALIAASPATAFLAVAMNRAIGLATGAALVLGQSFWQART